MKRAIILIVVFAVFNALGFGWNNLNRLQQDECIIQAVDAIAAGQRPCFLITKKMSVLGEDSAGFSSMRLLFSGFTPVKILAPQTLRKEFPSVVFVDDQRSFTDENRSNRKDYLSFYRPRLLFDEGTIVFALVSTISETELAKTVEKRPLTLSMFCNIDDDVRAIEREHGLVDAWRKLPAFRRNEACAFRVSSGPTGSNGTEFLAVCLSKRELSEFVYGLCGENDYVKLSTNSLLLPKSDVLPLETDIGKRLHFLKTHPDECDKMRAEVEKARIRLKQGMC